MLNVLSSGYVRVGQGKDEMYVWPYFAETDLAKLTPAQEVELYRIVPPALALADEEGRQIHLLPARHLADRSVAIFPSIGFGQGLAEAHGLARGLPKLALPHGEPPAHERCRPASP